MAAAEKGYVDDLMSSSKARLASSWKGWLGPDASQPSGQGSGGSGRFSMALKTNGSWQILRCVTICKVLCLVEHPPNQQGCEVQSTR